MGDLMISEQKEGSWKKQRGLKLSVCKGYIEKPRKRQKAEGFKMLKLCV